MDEKKMTASLAKPVIHLASSAPPYGKPGTHTQLSKMFMTIWKLGTYTQRSYSAQTQRSFQNCEALLLGFRFFAFV
jgi:hypothetical protein